MILYQSPEISKIASVVQIQALCNTGHICVCARWMPAINPQSRQTNHCRLSVDLTQGLSLRAQCNSNDGTYVEQQDGSQHQSFLKGSSVTYRRCCWLISHCFYSFTAVYCFLQWFQDADLCRHRDWDSRAESAKVHCSQTRVSDKEGNISLGSCLCFDINAGDLIEIRHG